MLRFVILSLFFLHVSPTSFWGRQEAPKLIFDNVTLEKDKPIDLSIEEDRVKLQQLEGTLYSDSLSLLKVRDLDLKISNLKNVESGALCSSSSLKRLRFSFKSTRNFTFSKEMFNNCENLKELELAPSLFTKLFVEADITENLPNLTKLYLHELENDHLERDFFKNLPLLEFLTMSRCYFETIENDAFEDLKHLKDLELVNMPELAQNLQIYFEKLKLDKLKIIDYNETLSLDWLANLTLKEVLVKFKYLDEIKEGICLSFTTRYINDFFEKGVTISKEVFENFQNLEHLAISGQNRIEADLFNNLSKLKSLELRGLKIPHITRKLFKNLRNLELLRLDSIHFTTIDEDAFEDLKNLTFLEIKYNDLFLNIPEKLFGKLARLETLSLSFNDIYIETWDEFKGLSSLKKLILKHSSIKTLNADKIATNMPSLNELDYSRYNNKLCGQDKVFAEKLQTKLGHPVRTVCDLENSLELDLSFRDC